MKRCIAFALALSLACMCFAPNLAVTASAASLGADESHNSFTLMPMEKDPGETVIWSQSRSPQLNFASLAANSSILGATCWVTQGTTVLKVNYCTWDAGKTIYIGFFNLGDGNNYNRSFSSGHISSVNLYTDDVPTGNYAVYVKNGSNSKILSGILDYEVIG